MNIRQLQSMQARDIWPMDSVHLAHGPIGHRHIGQRAMSRRQFLATVGLAAAALGAAFYMPGRAYAKKPGNAEPRPIPGGIQPFGPGTPIFHVLLPGYPPLGSPDPATNEPSVVGDLNGHVGLAYVQGMGTHTDIATGVERRLPFEVDLRFMKGEYVGLDGEKHQGAFALI